jgi:hypothetical protein
VSPTRRAAQLESITREEIEAVFQELDRMDGRDDAAIPLGTFPGSVPLPDQSPEAFLRKLECW